MVRVGVIGCGRLGQRHVQSLANLEEEAEIFLVDPDVAALARTEELVRQQKSVEQRTNVLLRRVSLNELPKNIDLVIVATNSFQRAAITLFLLREKLPKWLILEKFLFPRTDQYHCLERQIEHGATKVWVNQWMTSEPAFRRLFKLIGSELPLEMSVRGVSWGLCSNCLHFLEFFDKLTGRGELRLEDAKLDPVPVDNGREDYLDATGSLSFSADRSSRLVLVSSTESGFKKNSVLPENMSKEKIKDVTHQNRGTNDFNRGQQKHLKLTFKTDTKEVSCTYQPTRLECYVKEISSQQRYEFDVSLQSRMTAHVLFSLLESGDCDLPNFARSAQQHLLVLGSFEQFFKSLGRLPMRGVPVT